MGTEVFRPQDCLIQRIRVSPAPRKPNGNPRTYRKPSVRSDERKNSPISKRSEDFRSKQAAQNNVASGCVTILKKGELLDSKMSKKQADEMVPDLSPIRLTPAPGASCRSDMYAGSAFSLSPSPRALPLPSFFSKKQSPKLVDDPATRDLRRLLRLD